VATKKKKLHSETEQGFTLMEAVVALTLVTMCLGFSMPLFLYVRINNKKSELRTGAIIVAQQVLDNIRQGDPTTLPSNTSLNVQYTFPAPVNSQTVNVLGNNYTAYLNYCETAAYCTTNSREVRVEIKNNGYSIYTVAAIYTKFQ
jgi:type II secretory pathway pseudopilin PulG